jgi:hypothetical protein
MEAAADDPQELVHASVPGKQVALCGYQPKPDDLQGYLISVDSTQVTCPKCRAMTS